jgi:hypothetical protein
MGAYKDLCAALEERARKEREEKLKAITAEYADFERRIIEGLGLPAAFINGDASIPVIAPSLAYDPAFSKAIAQMKTQVGQWSLKHAVTRLLGRHNSADVGKEVQLHNNGRWRRFKVMHVHDTYVDLNPPEMATLRPLPTENTHPGFHPACASCAYGISCMQGRIGAICNHCRAAALPVEQIYATLQMTRVNPSRGPGEDLTPFFSVLSKIQPEHLRAPAACPLFQESLITCDWCKALGKKRHPVATRIFIESERHRRQRLSTPYRVKQGPPAFRKHLEKHLLRGHAPDLHRNRYAPQKQNDCAQRRSRSASSKR